MTAVIQRVNSAKIYTDGVFNGEISKGLYILLGVKKEDCLYIGDTGTDMKTGKNAGLYTIGVLWGFRKEPELKENGADIIISHPSEIVSIAKRFK